MDNLNELELDLDNENEEQKELTRAQTRNKTLSEKVKTTAQERDEAKAEAEKRAAEAEAARKDAEFYKNFTNVSSKYQGAGEYQDKIREKVNAGYSLEDATVTTLVAEGKFVPPAAPPPPKESPAGGSAVNTLKASGEKQIGEMTRQEKLAALEDAEKRGDISLS